MSSPHEQTPAIHYTVDGEAQESAERMLTPAQIITNAGLDPGERYLVEIRGHQQVSFKDKMDEPIKLHENQKFVTVFTGPVPVA